MIEKDFLKRLNNLKERACKEIDNLSSQLIEISDYISKNPEIGGKEYLAVKVLTEELEKHEFQIERGIGGISTSFNAEYKYKTEGPALAMLAEYDALPEIGHACGHNISGTASLGAAIALSKMDNELKGKIICLGTPAEENIGGKYIMLKNKVFDNIDVAMMVHAGDRNSTNLICQALNGFEFNFKGKPSHAAAAPYEGINALDAVIMLFNSINALRQQLNNTVRIHGIITKGGNAVNIIPDSSSARFYIRDNKRSNLNMVINKVKNCAKGASLQTGCELTIIPTEEPGNEVIQNSFLIGEYEENLIFLGEKLDPGEKLLGSTDVGNVSYVVPTIQPMIKTASEGTPLHTEQIVKDGLSEIGHNGLIIGAKVLAMTAIRVLLDMDFFKKVNRDFLEKK